MKAVAVWWMTIAVLLSVTVAQAESPATLPTTAPAGLSATLWERMKGVDAKAAGIRDLTADFEQKKFTPLLKKPMVSRGTVIAKGSVMLWKTTAPAATIMRVDEQKLQVFYPEQKTLEVYDMAGQMAELASSPVPRLAMLLGQFKFEPAPGEFAEGNNPDRLSLRMTPATDALKEHVDHVTVLLDTAHGFIVSISLVDADDERTEIRFSNVGLNSNVDDAQLNLSLPPSVKIVHPIEGLGAKPPASGGQPSK